jgi:glucose-6-phosphate 1-epimerase
MVSEEIPMSVPYVFDQLALATGIKLVNSSELYPALHKAGDAGLPMLVVDNRLGRAIIAPQGAQLMAFQPAGQEEMFWVSPKCVLGTR